MPKSTALTKEYLDKQFKSFLRHFDAKLDAQSKDLKSSITLDLKEHISKEIADLAGMTQRQFHETNEKIDRIQRDLSGRIVDH